MTDDQIRFFDSIITPWRELELLLREHPLAANPGSNALIVKAQSLALTLNHFHEKSALAGKNPMPSKDNLRNLCNSVKHNKGAETDVSCHLVVRYEYLDDTFRFITNEIRCRYLRATNGNKGCEFSAASQIWEAILWYAQILEVDISNYSPQESSYEFSPVAVAFSRPKYACYTSNVSISFFEKVSSDYQPIDPEIVKFVVLSEGDIGTELSKSDWRQVMQ